MQNNYFNKKLNTYKNEAINYATGSAQQVVKVTAEAWNLPNELSSQYDQYNHDLNKDVWIGDRPLQMIGFQISRYTAHWCCMVDGVVYSLDTDTGGAGGNIVINQTSDNKYDNWEYKGKLVATQQQVFDFVQWINSQKIPYNLLFDNCQHYSMMIANYAMNPKFYADRGRGLRLNKGSRNKVKTFTDIMNGENQNGWLYEEEFDKLNYYDKQRYLKENNINNTYYQFQLENQRTKDIQEKIKIQQQQYQDFQKKGFFLSEKEEEMFNRGHARMPIIQTIGQTSKNIQTIGQMKNVRNMPSKLKTTYTNIDNYNKDFNNLYTRRQQLNGVNQGPSRYNQPEFNIKSSPYQNTGFTTSGAFQPTIRKNLFSDRSKYNVNNQVQSFQQLNYDLPSQVQKSKQPFSSTYNYDTEVQPFKRVQTQSAFQPPNDDYYDNDYTNQDEIEEEDNTYRGKRYITE